MKLSPFIRTGIFKGNLLSSYQSYPLNDAKIQFDNFNGVSALHLSRKQTRKMHFWLRVITNSEQNDNRKSRNTVIYIYVVCGVWYIIHTHKLQKQQPSFQHPIVTLIYHKLFLPRWAGHTEEKGYNSISAYSEHGSGGGETNTVANYRRGFIGLCNRK